MENRIVDISSDGVYLHVSRGFLCVEREGETLGRIAIDDLSGVMIRGHGTSLSVNVCSRLAEANVLVVICGANQSPNAVVWPIAGHHAQGLHMQAQAVANQPLRKRLWAQLVRGKIGAQIGVLRSFGLETGDVRLLEKRVKAGDSGGCEAQAARLYWRRLFGEDFRRDQGAGGANAALNYGYTVLRAAVARSILAAGLHPSLSIHHQSKGDALRLADDLMEPFRPWVDYKVKSRGESGEDFELSGEFKAELVSVLQMDFAGPLGASPMQTCLDRMTQSLARVYLGEVRSMELPGQPLQIFVR